MARDIFLIYARATNGTIGKVGKLPWHIPTDLKRFKALTMGENGAGKPMIMGRKTFESFPSPLPGRRHIVLTHNQNWQAKGAEVVHTVEDALALAGDGEIAVVGGAEIYALLLPHANRVELTEVHAEVEGETKVPSLGSEWQEVHRDEHPAQGERPAFAFVTLTRVL